MSAGQFTRWALTGTTLVVGIAFGGLLVVRFLAAVWHALRGQG